MFATGGLDPLLVEGLSPSGQRDTGGDVNPDCLGVFAPISFGWPHRWPPTPAVPAISCFARLCFHRSRTPYAGAFSNFAGHFRARRRWEIYSAAAKSQRNIEESKNGYPPPRASAFAINTEVVHKSVENVAGFAAENIFLSTPRPILAAV
jgi:hypothetical protein